VGDWAGNEIPGVPVPSLIIFYDDLVLVDLDDAGTVFGEHFAVNFIYDAFMLKLGEIIDFVQEKGIDSIAGFVYTLDFNIHRQMAPLQRCDSG